MASMTNYTVNKFLVDTLFRGQTSPTIPTTLYYGLFVAANGYWTASTVYGAGATVLPATPNGHVYKTTAGGTSGTNAAVFSGATTPGQSVTDNTVTWVEQTTNFLAGTFTEATYGSYARVAQASSLANWAGTQGAATTVASNGTSGVTSNNNVITFPAPTSAQTGVVCGVILADALTTGDIIAWAILTNPKTINNGDAAPNFPAAAFTFTWS